MSAGFYLGDNASSGSVDSRSSTSSAPLPFPEPLPRSDFFAPDFDPSTYLSSLGHRHQTLEDLRADLRARSQLLSQELLDLVNSNYNEFLSLGTSLQGGEEKVEELRVGLLSLKREFESVRADVAQKETSVRALIDERRALRAELERGRRLLEWEDKLASLESTLMLDSLQSAKIANGAAPAQNGSDDGLSESSEDDDDDDDAFASDNAESHKSKAEEYGSAEKRAAIARVQRHVHEYKTLEQTSKQIGSEHPYILEQKSRVLRLRNTLLLDIRSVFRSGSTEAPPSPAALLRVMALYRDMDAAREGVEVLSNSGLRAH